MTFSLHGQAVSQGIAIGRAHLVSHATLEVAHFTLRERRQDIVQVVERVLKVLTGQPRKLGRRGKGARVIVDTEGELAEEAAEALIKLIADKFGEDE